MIDLEKKENSSEVKFTDKVKEIWNKLCRNSVTVSKDGSEAFSMPAAAFIIICLLSLNVVFAVILISLFFGVEYTVSGEDIPEGRRFSFR